MVNLSKLDGRPKSERAVGSRKPAYGVFGRRWPTATCCAESPPAERRTVRIMTSGWWASGSSSTSGQRTSWNPSRSFLLVRRTWGGRKQPHYPLSSLSTHHQDKQQEVTRPPTPHPSLPLLPLPPPLTIPAGGGQPGE